LDERVVQQEVVIEDRKAELSRVVVQNGKYNILYM